MLCSFRKNSSTFSYLIASIVFTSCWSCAAKPAIHSFTVTPLTITSNDTVKVNWDVKGKATLLVHENLQEDSSVRYLELTLVAERNSKEVNRPVQVAIVPKNTTTQIIFSTDLKGDTLIATGEKNIEKWGNLFEIASISSKSDRPIIVVHANKTALLSKAGTPSFVLAGTPVEGAWELKSLVTAAEKKDMSTAPETLQVIAEIKYKKR